MAECVVKSFKRDYLYLNELPTAETSDGSARNLV